MDPAASQALMGLLPAEVRAALENGAAPEDVAQSLLMQRLQQSDNASAAPTDDADEEPWPEVGWTEEMSPQAPQVEPRRLQEPAVYATAISALEERLADLARALGGCTLCLGESVECPVCRGQGAPGWSVPEPALFEALVVPALRRLQATHLRDAQLQARRFSQSSTTENSNGHRPEGGKTDEP